MSPQFEPIIAFTSKYGSARRYAREFAERTGATAVDLRTESVDAGSAPLVILAPIYAGRLFRLRALRRAVRTSRGPVAVGVVGMSPVDDELREPVADSLRELAPGRVDVFQLPGDYDPRALTFFHRTMMKYPKAQLKKTPDRPGAREILRDLPLDAFDADALEPLVEWARR